MRQERASGAIRFHYRDRADGAGDFLIEGIRKHFVEKAFHASEGTEIALAILGNDVGMYGCVRLLF